ncbi:MAG: hypothetical protein AAF366_14090 [Pseudomonadota bacterium]
MAKTEKGPQDVGRSARGGVSLSRAKRLSDQVHGKQASNRLWLGLLPIGILVAGGVWYQTKLDGPASIDAATPADTAAAGDDGPAVAQAAAADVTSPPEDPVRTPVTEAASAVPNTCEGMIERRLDEVRGLADTYGDGLAWTDYRTTITSLVQQVLNCPAAGLDVVGSLELLDTDLADLQVSWDVVANQMTLTTIVDGGAALAPEEGDHINFVLR